MSKGKKSEKGEKPAKGTPRRNSVTAFIAAKIKSGATNVDTILDGINKEFPDSKATRGYVRHIARNVLGTPLASKAKGKAEAKAPKAKGKTESKAPVKAKGKTAAKAPVKAKGKAKSKVEAKADPAPAGDQGDDSLL